MEDYIAPVNAKPGMPIAGLEAVAATYIAGVEAFKKGIAQPISSLTQVGGIHLNHHQELVETL
jgi:myo-inositol-1-phosphate synthase